MKTIGLIVGLGVVLLVVVGYDLLMNISKKEKPKSRKTKSKTNGK